MQVPNDFADAAALALEDIEDDNAAVGATALAPVVASANTGPNRLESQKGRAYRWDLFQSLVTSGFTGTSR